MICGVLLLLIGAFSPLGNVLLLSLSERFPAWHDSGRAPDGIIVLGGSISPELTLARGLPEVNDAAERMIVAAQLARRYPQAKIVLSGGNGNLVNAISTEAEVSRQLLEDLGVAHERIVMEDRSRTTYENARFTRDLIQPKPGELWLLVTSAWHMPRSIGVFRAVGFDVEAFPVDWRTRGWHDAWVPFAYYASESLSRLDTVAHEWVGLVTYRALGRSNELLPAEQPR